MKNNKKVGIIPEEAGEEERLSKRTTQVDRE